MNIILITILVLSGAIIGIISSLLGIGGGILLVPILLHIFLGMGIPLNISMKLAVGTALSIIFLTSIGGAYYHNKKNSILWKCVFFLGFFGIIGSIIGVYISTHYLSGNFHKVLFGILLSILSINIFLSSIFNRKKLSNVETIPFCTDINYFVISLLGLIVGIISSIFGIGGGVIIIPFLNIIVKMPLRLAIGTSVGTMVIISFSGTLGYLLSKGPHIDGIYNIGYVSLLVVGIMVPVGILFSKLGTELSHSTRPIFLRILLSIVMFIAGVKMIFYT